MTGSGGILPQSGNRSGILPPSVNCSGILPPTIGNLTHMHECQTIIATLALAALLLGGCTKTTVEQAPVSTGSSVSPAATSVPEVAPALHVIDEEQFAEILEKHRGEVVLVDFWATWCMECLELMPHTVELHKNLADQGLHVMLVSLDSPEDRRDAVEKLLVKNGVTFDSYISQYGADPKSAEAFEIEAAALPNIKLYDRNGALRKVFSAGHMPPEPFDAHDVEKAVRELLAEE